VILLEKNKGPVIVIVITVLVAFACFLLYDHSGMTVNDISLESDNTDETVYNLTYYLILGRNFNELNCECIAYDQNNQIITNTSSILKDVYPGTHTISSQINLTNNENSLNKSSKISSVQIDVYDNFLNDTKTGSHKRVYSKRVNL